MEMHIHINIQKKPQKKTTQTQTNNKANKRLEDLKILVPLFDSFCHMTISVKGDFLQYRNHKFQLYLIYLEEELNCSWINNSQLF